LVWSPLILLLPLAHLLFRLGYYGHPFPNTYYLKLTAYDGRFLAGLNDLIQFTGAYFPALGLAFVGAVFARDRRIWALLLAGIPLVVYTLFTGGDDFGGARFFAPWLPLLFLTAFYAPHWFGWQNRPFRVAVITAVLAAVTALMGGYDFFQGPGNESILTNGGLILEEATLPDTLVGVFWAGTLPYFAHRPSVDMLGKNDAYIARLPANEGSFKPGHNKFDYDYSLARLQPDLLVSPLSLAVVADPRVFSFYLTGDDAYAGRLFLDETFQQQYAPTLLMIGSMPLFVRSDSPERERLVSAATCEFVTNEELLQYGLEIVCRLNL
jgi:hypothetical protein